MADNSLTDFAPKSPRITIERDADGLNIVIPGRFSVVALFMIPWLGFWTLGGISAITELLNAKTPSSGRAFLVLWLCGWAFGELAVSFAIMWMFAGRERLKVSGGVLTQWRGIGKLGQTRRFEITGIGNLGPVFALSRRGFGRQHLAFEYGMRTYRIAQDADEAESRAVADALKREGADGAGRQR